MSLFPLKKVVESVAVHLLGPLPKTKEGNRFILVMTYPFTTLTKGVPLKRTTGLDFAKAFESHWIFKYGVSKKVLFDKGPQFVCRLYQNTFRILSIANTITSAYHT